METVIELIDVCKEFDSVKAVDHFSLSIAKGEVVSLLGPSGCGKTTTLRMIAGFETPTYGQILLEGKDVIRRPVRDRNMTMVFQNYALFPHMTVFDNIAFGLSVRHERKGVIRDKVSELLSVVKLNGYEKRKPHQLSGGQQQRVALARALISNPIALLLDEPFGALDKKLRETMQLEIRSILKQLQTTAVFVTHDQEEALVLSDRIVVMNQGRIEQIATPRDMYEHPKTVFVAGFIGISNNFSGAAEKEAGGRAFIRLTDGSKLYFDGDAEQDQGTDPVTYLTIRPEKVGISSDTLEGDNLFGGIVEDIKYLGTVTEYYVKMDGGYPMVVHCQNSTESASYSLGDSVRLRVPPSQLRQVSA